MELLPQEIRDALPKYTHDLEEPATALVKWFTPDANAVWFVAAIDGDRAWGVADLGLGSPEYGSFSVSEIATLTGVLGLPVERDLYFEPKPLRDILRTLEAGGHV